MRTLIHLSDLHFGRTDPEIIEPLVAQVHELKPDLVVVSGDLTQRARAASSKRPGRFSTCCRSRSWWYPAITMSRSSTLRRGYCSRCAIQTPHIGRSAAAVRG
jgi:3',5'-cyclic AMP phosphodiesterase CpdA